MFVLEFNQSSVSIQIFINSYVLKIKTPKLGVLGELDISIF